MSLNPYKYVLLLGAGFTRNFGGLLAREIWTYIFNQKEIQSTPNLRSRMLRPTGQNYQGYEYLYSEIVQNGADDNGCAYTPEEREIFQKAVERAFEKLDHIIVHPKLFPPHFGYMHKWFIGKFNGENAGRHGFIFTLNQDLWFERHYGAGLPTPYLPGIGFKHPKKDRTIYESLGETVSAEDLFQLPGQNQLAQNPIEDSLTPFSYVKLHGSYNFLSAVHKGTRAMVTGQNKSDSIADEPLLDAYSKLFEKVLSSGGVKLLVIGYGFGDEHINSVLERSVEEGKIELYVLNPEDQFEWRDRLYRTANNWTWRGLSGYLPYDLKTLFPNDRDSTTAWEHVQETYFA